MWWHTLVITALGRLRQEDHKFEFSVAYTMEFCIKKQKQGWKDGLAVKNTTTLAKKGLLFDF